MNLISDRLVFISIVDEGSITRAANRLGLSLAVCSKRLANLEERLGVRLLNRTTRKQHLTDEGSVYYGHCLRIEEDIEAMESSIAGMRDNIQGTIRVTASAAFGHKYISPVVPLFLKQNPKIKIQLIMTDTVVDMLTEGIDVAIRMGELEDSSLVAVKLATGRRVLCASPTYLEKAGTPKTPEDLKSHQCVLISPQTNMNDTWEFETEHGIKRIPVNAVVSSNSGEAVRDIVNGGVGIAMKSLWDINDHLQSGELVTILDNYHLSHTNIYAVYHNRDYVSPKIRAWIDFFKQQFANKEDW